VTADDRGTCRSCAAPILWAITEKGRRIPLDPEPTGGGNISTEERIDGHLNAHVMPSVPGVPGYVSHFVTCEFAGRHRRRRGG
jgi:hypothetical protein